MENILELKERIMIIMTSTLDDIKIMDSNYMKLIKSSDDHVEKEQFKILHKNATKRIKELSN